MHMVEWLAGTALTYMTAKHLTRSLAFRELKDRVISVLLLWITLICVSVFVSGAVVRSLTNLAFLCVNLVLFIAAFAVLHRRTQFTRLLPRVNLSWQRVRQRLSLHRRQVSGLVAFYGLVLAAFLVLTAYIGYLLPPYSFDELGYHLVSVAAWIHAHRFVDSGTLWADVYPKNAELVFTWLYMSVHTDRFVHLGQWIFGIMGIAAVIGTARLLGLARRYAVIAGVLFFSAPSIMLQATTDYVDLAYASTFLTCFYFYLRYSRTCDRRYILLSGIAGGLALGMKSDAVVYIGVLCVIAVIRYVFWLRRQKTTWKKMMLDISAFALPVIVLGTYWYIHTWIEYGNPVYPFTVSLHGHVIFHGTGTVDQLIMDRNTPVNLLHLPWWKQVWISWTSIPTVYAYDMRIGGFGLQWTFLELPALVIFTIYLAVKNRRLLFQVLVPLVAIFVLQPANWWARYTLFMVALGAWAIVYVLNLLKQSWLRTAIYSVLLLVITGFYAAGILLVTTNQQRVTGYVAESIRRALPMPAPDRTVGSVVFKEYQWLDTLQEPTSFAVDFNVRFAYAFYGRGAKNTVTILNQQTHSAFMQAITALHPQYVVTSKGDEEDGWARRDPKRFKFIGQHLTYNVYQVTY